MKKFEHNYKLAFKNIKLPKPEATDIKNNILSSNTKYFKPQFILLLSAILLFCGVTIVYGKEIVNILEGLKWTTEVPQHPELDTNSNYYVSHYKDYIEIKDKNSFTKKDIGNEFSYSEIEDKLGIKLLKSSFLNKNEFKLHFVDFHDSNISKVGFTMNNDPVKLNKENQEENLRFSFKLWTQFSTEEERNTPSQYLNTELYKMTTYHINSIDTDAYIFEDEANNYNRPKWMEECNCYPLEARIYFTYAGISYDILISKVDRADFYNMLDSLTLE